MNELKILLEEVEDFYNSISVICSQGFVTDESDIKEVELQAQSILTMIRALQD